LAEPTRVLITGGSGFVGANLARAEIAAGREVHLLLRQGARLWRLAGLAGRYAAHTGDVTCAADVRRAVEASRPEVVYHLAAHGVYPSQTDRAAILATNLAGTLNVLEAMAGRDYLGLVHTGSSAEYGHKDGPMRESDLLEPRTDYAVTKAAATLFCQAEAYKGAPVVTVRLFNAYGPWEDPARRVPYVMGCCARGEAPRVTAGRQPRDFVYIDDVVELLRLAARSPAAHGQILNAGSGRQHTVGEMIETIVHVCGGGRVRPDYGAAPSRPDEPTCWVADLEQVTARTGWRPRYDLAGGVRAMWRWHQGGRGQAA
jgi:nucleoside-diphosphate-sugar epimerase